MNTILLCLEVFLARMIDVSIGVIRMVELVKENAKKAVILAFFEVLIWFLVVKDALTSDDFNIFVAIFYALGYAAGTYLGSYLSKKLMKENVGVQVITCCVTNKEIRKIKKEGYGVSSVTMDGKNKKMLFLEVDEKKLKPLISFLESIDPHCFITISNRKMVYRGYF